MNFKNLFKQNIEEEREKHKEQIEELKGNVKDHLDKCENVLILITENGCLVGGVGRDVQAALSTFFATMIDEGQFSEEELLTCLKVGSLAAAGKLDKLNKKMQELNKILDN